MHKCQGMAQLLALPAPSARDVPARRDRPSPASCRRTRRRCSTASTARIAGLAQFAGPRPPKDLVDGLGRDLVDAVQTRAEDSSTPATTKRRQAAHRGAPRGPRRCAAAPRDGRSTTPASSRSTSGCGRRKREFQQAISSPTACTIEALADDGVVVPGQPVKVYVIVANHGAADVAIKQVKFDGFDGETRVHDDGDSSGGGFGGGRGARQRAAPPRAADVHVREGSGRRTASRR